MINAAFNALNGSELIEVIKEEIGIALERSGEFKPHTTFPWVKYSYEIKVLGYPQQDIKEEPKIKVKGEHTGLDEFLTPDGAILETLVDLKDEKVIDTPDKARVETGLPVPTPAPASGKIIVDKPIMRGPKKK